MSRARKVLNAKYGGVSVSESVREVVLAAAALAERHGQEAVPAHYVSHKLFSAYHEPGEVVDSIRPFFVANENLSLLRLPRLRRPEGKVVATKDILAGGILTKVMNRAADLAKKHGSNEILPIHLLAALGDPRLPSAEKRDLGIAYSQIDEFLEQVTEAAAKLAA